MDSLEFLITFSLALILAIFIINTLNEKVYIKSFENLNKLHFECEIYKKIQQDINIAGKINLESRLNESNGKVYLKLDKYSCSIN